MSGVTERSWTHSAGAQRSSVATLRSSAKEVQYSLPTSAPGAGKCAHRGSHLATRSHLRACAHSNPQFLSSAAFDPRLDRVAMYDWLMRIKQPDGSFLVHEGGEVDVR